jgi:hypothetical protein
MTGATCQSCLAAGPKIAGSDGAPWSRCCQYPAPDRDEALGSAAGLSAQIDNCFLLKRLFEAG